MIERNPIASSSSSSSPGTPPPPPHHHPIYDEPSHSRYPNSPSPILPTYEETIQPGRHRQDIEQPPPQTRRSNEEKSSEEKQRRRRILSYLCCICCPCFPMWTRYICCFLFFAMVVFAITAGILAALFQMPTITFNGATDHPDGLPRFENLTSTGNSSIGAFNINMGLNFTITNPNVEGLVFDKIKALAYYPIQPTRPFGGGNMTHLTINPGSTTQFVFPFQLHYDPTLDPGYAILFDMMTRCGFLGPPHQQDIQVNYDLKPTVRVVGVPVSPTIHQTASFPCPVQNGQLTMPKGLLSA